MEAIKLRYAAMQQALITLQEGLHEVKTSIPERPKADKLMRDGVMQRFEYCIDSFWKFLKLYLEEVQEVAIVSPSPRPIIRLAFDSGLITEVEYEVFLDSLRDRNLTSHTYNEDTANEIESHIPSYFDTMKTVLDRLVIYEN